MQNLLGDTNIR
jgi:hypothetical protein